MEERGPQKYSPGGFGGVIELFCVLTVALLTCLWAFLLKLCSRTLCPETYILQHVNNIPVKKRIKKSPMTSWKMQIPKEHKNMWLEGLGLKEGFDYICYFLIVIVVIKLHTLVKIHRAVQQKVGKFYCMLIIP